MTSSSPKITALTVDELAAVLRQSGCAFDAATIRSRIEAHLVSGAPANDDSTINFIRYLAWLLTQQN